MPETAKGILFNVNLKFIKNKNKPELLEKISKKLGKPLKYIDFFDYPAQELLVIVEEIAKNIFPHKKTDEVYYLLAQENFATLAQTPILKAMLPRAKKNPRIIAPKIPFLYKQIYRFGEISVVDLEEKSCRIVFKNYVSLPQLQQGFLQKVSDVLGFNHKVGLNIHKFINNGNGDIKADFDLTLRWD
ncbi:MAG: DUF2378 family protein [Candidatus Omnitrophota bacterium]